MTLRIGKELLYLSRQTVLDLAITPAQVTDAVEASFRAKAEGRGFTRPKILIARPDGKMFMAKAGATLGPAYAAIKWLGFFPGNIDKGMPDYIPLILLNDGETGYPIALMDGTWLTERRTGSMSALAARYMARPESSRVGFIAAGSQARGHLDALIPLFKLSEVVVYSRTLRSAEAFAAYAATLGLAARATAKPREAVEGMDIVVSSVPHKSVGSLELDGAWVAPGTYAAMVDLGYSWRTPSLEVFTRIVTDDVEQSGPNGSEKLNYQGAFAGELADLVGGSVRGRESPAERNAFIFSGVGLADTLPAALVYERAMAAGKGTILPL
ncbi:MAG: ornithine cyclodeaminase family protein [Hyphomicrobiaceae bacterium]